MGDMGISSMIQMMLETSKDFEGFDAITLTVELNGKKLRINIFSNQFRHINQVIQLLLPMRR